MSFVIYQGEAGLRSENMRLKADKARLEAENARLRALVGEPELVAAIAAEALQAQRLQPQGQSFSTGECQVTIGAMPKAPQINPMIARARGLKTPTTAAPAQAVQPLDLPVSTQPQDAEAIENENAPSQRFQLIELRK